VFSPDVRINVRRPFDIKDNGDITGVVEATKKTSKPKNLRKTNVK